MKGEYIMGKLKKISNKLVTGLFIYSVVRLIIGFCGGCEIRDSYYMMAMVSGTIMIITAMFKSTNKIGTTTTQSTHPKYKMRNWGSNTDDLDDDEYWVR